MVLFPYFILVTLELKKFVCITSSYACIEFKMGVIYVFLFMYCFNMKKVLFSIHLEQSFEYSMKIFEGLLNTVDNDHGTLLDYRTYLLLTTHKKV